MLNDEKINYGTKFYRLLQSDKIPRAQIKRMFYDDKEEHRRLRLTELDLDSIWESLMDNRFKPINYLQIKKIKRRNKMIKPRGILQLDPITNKEINRFESAKEASEGLEISVPTIYSYLNGTAKNKNPRFILKYVDEQSQPSEPLIKLEKKTPDEEPQKTETLVDSKPVPASLTLAQARDIYIKALEETILERMKHVEHDLLKLEIKALGL